MTEPEDLVEVEVPAEQVRAGDLLEHEEQEGALRTVDHTIPDGDVIRVGFLAGDPRPVPRGHLVRVRRPRSATTLGVSGGVVTPEAFDAVRDLALALAERASAQGASVDKAGKRVADAADRVKGRRTPEESPSAPATPVAPAPAPVASEQPGKGKR